MLKVGDMFPISLLDSEAQTLGEGDSGYSQAGLD
jgi:hypothetical protein